MGIYTTCGICGIQGKNEAPPCECEEQEYQKLRVENFDLAMQKIVGASLICADFGYCQGFRTMLMKFARNGEEIYVANDYPLMVTWIGYDSSAKRGYKLLNKDEYEEIRTSSESDSDSECDE